MLRQTQTLTLTLALLAGSPSVAAAQEQPPQEGWRLALGAGALYAPAYEGDDEYRLSILPNIQVAYGERFAASVQDGARYRWINTPDWRAGPIARLRFGRDEDGGQPFAVTGDDSNDLRGLGDVDTSVELGGFVEYDLGAFAFSAEARQAVNGHEGLIADFGARWTGRTALAGSPVFLSLGPRLRFVDNDFASAYFGVTPGQSVASGLAVFSAGGGLHSYGASISGVAPLTPDQRWTAVFIASLDRLTGDAADSPLVRERGDATQASVGMFISRSF